MIRDPETGREWGTAAEIAYLLGVTRNRIYDWARRADDPDDPLHGKLPRKHFPGRGRGTTWYALDQARTVERITRQNVEQQGGPTRGPRAELTQAA